MNPSDERSENLKILERGVTAYLDEIREHGDIWRTLESKAQALITASGIFLAAAFAFSREPSLAPLTKVLVFITLASLLWALSAALGVLRVTDYEMPDGGKAVSDALLAVAKPMHECGRRYEGYLSGLLDDAPQVLASLEKANRQKHEKLAGSMQCLAAAAFLSVVASLAHLLWPVATILARGGP